MIGPAHEPPPLLALALSRLRHGVQGTAPGRLRWTKDAGVPETPRPASGKRREYLREYLRWLWPHRFAIGFFFLLALLAAGLEMIEPLFMRFIIDRVLLNTGARHGRAARAAAPGRRRCSSRVIVALER